MPSPYSITLDLQLANVVGLDRTISQVQSKFRQAKVDLDVRLNPRAAAGVEQLNSRLVALNTTLKDVRANAAGAASALAGIGKVFQSGAASVTGFAKAAQTASGSARRAADIFADATNFSERFAAQSALAGRRFLAFSLATAGIVKFVSAAREGFSQAVAFEKEMNRVAQATGASAAGIRALQGQITHLSTSLGVSSKELAHAAYFIETAGIKGRDATKALEALAKASLAPEFGSLKDVTEGVVASFQQFGKNADNIEKDLGAMNAVANEFAVEAKDLVTVVQKAGGAFAQTGGKLHELLALFTSVRSTTRESAETISTGLRTIFTRLQRQDTVEALKRFKIELRETGKEAERLGTRGQFVGGFEAIKRISEGLAKMPRTSPEFAQITELLGGVRNISRVIPLVTQFGEAQRALNVAQSGGVSLTIAAEKAQETLANRAGKTKEEFLGLFRAITEDKGFKTLVHGALDLANALVKVANFARPLIPLFAAFAGAKLVGAIGQGVFRGSGIFPNIARGFSGGPGASGGRLASGGTVPGYGHADTVPAMLMPGEFVINKRAAARIGLPALHRLNAQHFARGGPVQHFDKGGQAHEVFFQSISRSDPVYEQVVKAAEGAALALRPLTKVILELKEAGQYAFKGFAENQKLYQPRGRLSALEKQGGLTPEQETLATRNLPFVNYVLNKRRTFVGGDPQSAFDAGQEALLKAAAKFTAPERDKQGNAITDPKAIDKLFRHYAFPYIAKAVEREAVAGQTGGIGGVLEKAGSGSLKLGRHDIEGLGRQRFLSPVEQSIYNERESLLLNSPAALKAGAGGKLDLPSLLALAASQQVTAVAAHKAKEFVGRAGAPPAVPPGSPVLPGPSGPDPRRRGITTSSFLSDTPVTRSVVLPQLGDVAKAQGLTLGEFTKLLTSVRRMATTTDRFVEVMRGSVPVVVEFRAGMARLKGVVGEAAIAAGTVEGRRPSSGQTGFTPTGPGTYPLKRAGDANERANKLLDRERQARADLEAGRRARRGQSYLPGTFDIRQDLYQSPAELAAASALRAAQVRDLTTNPGDAEKIERYKERQSLRIRDRVARAIEEQYAANGARRDVERRKREADIRRGLAPLHQATGVAQVKRDVRSALAGRGLDSFDVLRGARAALHGPELAAAPHLGMDVLAAAQPHLSPAQYARLQYEYKKALVQGPPAPPEIQGPPPPPGPGRFRRFFGGFGRGVGRYFGFGGPPGTPGIEGASAPPGEGWASRFGRYAGGGAFFALPIASHYLEQAGGTAEQAAVGGSAGFYTARTASGGVTGAVTGGFFAGAMTGNPYVAAAGALVGAIHGTVSAFQEADREIREVKIGNSLTGFSDKLGSLFVNGGEKYGAADVSAARTNLTSFLSLTREKAAKEATGFFSGFDAKQYSDITEKELRQKLGPQLPSMIRALSRFAEDAGKASPAGDLKTLTENFGRGNGGLNQQLLDVIARVMKISPERALEQYGQKSIEAGQRQAAAEKTGLLALQGSERAATSFSRLAATVEAVSHSMHGLQQQSQALEGVFFGNVSAGRVTGHAEALRTLGQPGNGAASALQFLVNATGGSAQARRLQASGLAVNEVSGILPGVLANIAGQNLGEKDTVSNRVRDGLIAALRQQGKPITPDVERVLNSVENALNHTDKGTSGILSQIAIDTSKYSKQLLRASAQPVQEYGSQANKLAANFANEVIEGFSKLRLMTDRVREGMERLAQVEGQEARVRAEFQGVREARTHEGINLLPLAALQIPFRLRQEGLLRGTGLAATAALDPAAIGARLGAVNALLPGASDARQAALIAGGPHTAAFTGAAKAFDRLKSSSGQLQQALAHLANAAERNAPLLEKLGKIQEDRSSRLAYADRFFHAGYFERGQMNRGGVLLAEAHRRGSILGFAPHEQGLILDTLSSLGRARLKGLKGEPIAADVKEQFFRQAGFDVAPDAKAEERKLQEQVMKNFTDAGKALREVANQQGRLQQDFFTNLAKQQGDFFSKLQSLLSSGYLGGLENQLTDRSRKVRDLENLKPYRALVGAAGVTSSSQLKALGGALPQIESLAETQRHAREKNAAFDRIDIGKLVEDVGDDMTRGGALGAGASRRLEDRLTGAGLTAYEVASVLGDYKKDLAKGGVKDSVGPDDVRQSMTNAVAAVRGRAVGNITGPGGEIESAKAALRSKGLDPEKVAAVLGADGKGLDRLKEALSGLEKSGESFKDLDKAVVEARRSFEELRETIEKLKRVAGVDKTGVVKAAGHAAGGPIDFRARGSDTVPAMLTPGEFVVNKRSAGANASLLKKINSASGPVRLWRGGPVYLAGGGELDPADPALEPPRPGRIGADAAAEFGARFGKPPGGKIGEDPDAVEMFKRFAGGGKDAAIRARGLLEEDAPPELPPVEGEGPAAKPKPKRRGMRVADVVAAVNKKHIETVGESKKEGRDLEAELRYQAATNPGGASAQLLARRAVQKQIDKRLSRLDRLEKGARKKADARDAFGELIPDAKRAESQLSRLAKLRKQIEGGQNNALGAAGYRAELAGRLEDFGRRSAAANAVDAGAAFGLGRADFSGQLGALGTSASIRSQHNELAARLDLNTNAVRNRYLADQTAKFQPGVKATAHYALGGRVGGSGNRDTVSAKLMPGEFVLRKHAVEALGYDTAERLNHIDLEGPRERKRARYDAAPNVRHYAEGGAVGFGGRGIPTAYYAAGGEVGGEGGAAGGGLAKAAELLTSGFTKFSSSAQSLTEALNKIPQTMKGDFNHTVDVRLNGAEVLAKLTPEIKNMVVAQTKQQLGRIFKEQMPDAGVHV